MSQDLILTLLIAAVVFMILSRTVSFADALTAPIPGIVASTPGITAPTYAPCPDGMLRDVTTLTCMFPPCPTGMLRDVSTKVCMFPPCPSGQVRNQSTGLCQAAVAVPTRAGCPAGTRLNPITRKCVRNV